MIMLKALGLLYLLSVSLTTTASTSSSCRLVHCESPPSHGSHNSEFVERSSEFWAYDKLSGSWKQVDISKIFGNQSKINASSSDNLSNKGSTGESNSQRESVCAGDWSNAAEKLKEQTGESPPYLYDTGTNPGADIKKAALFSKDASNPSQEALPTEAYRTRRRVSLMRFSDASIWITGHSGSIYEMFWNGLQWVIIPHDLPNFAGYAVGSYAVNRTMLALSEEGVLYQLHVTIEGDIRWISCSPQVPVTSPHPGVASREISLHKPAMSSPDTSSLHFPTTDGLLFELVSIHPTKWLNHGQPRGGDVAAVVNVGTLRPGAVFTVSSKGDLYEYDPKAKPAWRKHIREGSSIESFPLEAATGVTLHDLAGPSSTSLFLMTKDGFLVERRLAQSKWRWLFHSSPENVRLTSIGPSFIDPNTGNTSVFCTTRNGTVYEYRLPYALGNAKYGSNSLESGTWIDYKQPADVPVMSSVVGASLGHGRFFFALEDGRIGELHLPGQGGPGVGPITRIPAGKRQPTSYTWSIFESPETEGGNAEYCNADHGPRNCLEGVKHATYYDESKVVSNGKSSQWKRPSGRGRARKSTYVTSSEAEETSSQSVISGSPSPVNQSLSDLFQFRTLQFNRSLFLVGGDGIVTEKFLDGDTWMWLKHEFATTIQGLVGIYNNSIYAVDSEGSLFILESIDNQLQWLNCTALEGGTTVLSGRPWDGVLGDLRVTTLDDALVFVSQSGQLFEFKVALRTFTWRNCGHPPGTKVAAILDQEVLRHRVVYVAGMDGKLYHFNRVTFLWHANKQPSDIVLSTIPGVVLRPNFQTTAGSLFLRAEDGSLVEYHWDNAEGWLWTKHGFPEEGVVLATAPGPSLVGSWIFMVVSDGRVFGRHWDGNKWVWIDCGYPSPDILLQEIGGSSIVPESLIGDSAKQDWKPFPLKENSGFQNFDVYLSFAGECNTMMAPVRPVAYASDTATFLLVDGRLAELKQIDEGTWGWTSIIETPTSSCQSTYWAAPES